MRTAALVVAAALLGCGGGARPPSAHATLSDVAAGNVAADAFVATSVDCTYDAVVDVLSCAATDAALRQLTVVVVGGVARGTFPIDASVAAHGDVGWQQGGGDGGAAATWQAVDGMGGMVTLSAWTTAHVSATFAAPMAPAVGDPLAMGTFMVRGDLDAPVTKLQ